MPVNNAGFTSVTEGVVGVLRPPFQAMAPFNTDCVQRKFSDVYMKCFFSFLTKPGQNG